MARWWRQKTPGGGDFLIRTEGTYELFVRFGHSFEQAADALFNVTPENAGRVTELIDPLIGDLPRFEAARTAVQRHAALASPSQRARIAWVDEQRHNFESRMRDFHPPGDVRPLAAKWGWARERLIIVSLLRRCRHRFVRRRSRRGLAFTREFFEFALLEEMARRPCKGCPGLPLFLLETAEPIRQALLGRSTTPLLDACLGCGLSTANFDAALEAARRVEVPMPPRTGA